MGYQVEHFINGKTVSDQTRNADIYDPATGDVIGRVSMANNEIVQQAIAAAKQAYPAWSATPVLRRAKIFFKYKTLLEDNLDELASLVTREHGKTLSDAKGSVQRGIELVDYVCGIPNLLKGVYAENIATDVDTYSIRQSLGVSVGITPFNFPAMIPLWMFPMSIACGNTFVLKPSERDPSCSIRLAELAKEAGLPDGVLNVVQGDKEAVDILLTHEDIKTISFVGSSNIAEYVYKTGTSHGKRVQAFGSAKNHCIVMPDADINQAVDAIVGAAYGSAGERCMAISVVVAVGNEVANSLIEKLTPRVRQLKIGKGTSKDIEFGPLISKPHLERVKFYVETGVKEGATLVVDGRDYICEESKNGYFMGGCLFDNVKTDMQIYQEEIFGPVLVVVRAPDFETALQLINDHQYGNGTAIFTSDGHTARTFASKVQVGMVGINVPIPVPVAYQPFGGWKCSVFGDIDMHSEGVMFFTKVKTITQRWLQHPKGTDFNIPTH